MHIRDEKLTLRNSIEHRLSLMDDRQRSAESRSLCRRLLPEISPTDVVCAYMALKTEPDLQLLITTMLERQQRLYLPVFHENRLAFRELTHLDTLRRGALNILEPPPDNRLLIPGEATIVIMPGRCFDKKGNRLGRGNGGYDIWLKAERVANPTAYVIGAAFECQVVNAVPTEEHDQRVDAIVTARGVEDVEK